MWADVMNVYNRWAEEHPSGFVRGWGMPRLSRRRGLGQLSDEQAGFAGVRFVQPSASLQGGAPGSHYTPPSGGPPAVRSGVPFRLSAVLFAGGGWDDRRWARPPLRSPRVRPLATAL